VSSSRPSVRIGRSSRCACVVAVLLALAAGGAHAQAPSSMGDRENDAFVVSYRCDRGAVAVAYPAYRDAATQPVRVAWQGRNYVMYPARSGSGARYVTRNGQLEWWTKGNDAFLAVPGVADKVLDRCEAF
jgi:membrane-bound inhibitor of C-type lysozyme